jgi:hypothetical protein
MIDLSLDEAIDDGALAYSTVSEEYDFIFNAVQATAKIRFMHYNY